ncbi:hypothetical protein C8R46DRAFT_1044840 [Mycena filopes]|nr:hypothetical protein C8R46DRAFT_1044840 [Mycena filopes]
MHFIDFKPSATLFETGPGMLQICHPSIFMRISFNNQAAFWAFSFLITQMPARGVASAQLSVVDHQNILRVLDFFKGDQGPEIVMGEALVAAADGDPNAPPDYAVSETAFLRQHEPHKKTLSYYSGGSAGHPSGSGRLLGSAERSEGGGGMKRRDGGETSRSWRQKRGVMRGWDCRRAIDKAVKRIGELRESRRSREFCASNNKPARVVDQFRRGPAGVSGSDHDCGSDNFDLRSHRSAPKSALRKSATELAVRKWSTNGEFAALTPHAVAGPGSKSGGGTRGSWRVYFAANNEGAWRRMRRNM